ncbi:MAG: hypothetical protein HXX08_11310 [Chloroflexi bacterium]|uniref:Uncharacterized protein n=1 Tax=Candidatus Chlorohelix allophototropha TaxID=3003348 RepID=A0A8T7LZJ5_9CHLR|nr:hypothetical protein [Chloroflexota bacterium]WJW65825.1 hypothetical protein OZ401_001604 [Chloroflexota bacterium L227-S17]
MGDTFEITVSGVKIEGQYCGDGAYVAYALEQYQLPVSDEVLDAIENALEDVIGEQGMLGDVYFTYYRDYQMVDGELVVSRSLKDFEFTVEK